MQGPPAPTDTRDMAGLLALGVFTPRRLPDPDGVSGMKGANSPITAAGTAPAHPASHTARKIPDSLFVPPSEEGVKPCRLPVYPSLCPRVNSIRILAPQRLHAKNVRMEPGCGHQKKAKFSSFAPALFLHGRRCGNESGIFCRKTSCRGYSMEISGYGSIFFSQEAEESARAARGKNNGQEGSALGLPGGSDTVSISEEARKLSEKMLLESRKNSGGRNRNSRGSPAPRWQETAGRGQRGTARRSGSGRIGRSFRQRRKVLKQIRFRASGKNQTA